MNASDAPVLEALPRQGILHQLQPYWDVHRQNLSSGLMLKASVALVCKRIFVHGFPFFRYSSPLPSILLIPSQFLAYVISHVIYNLYFHPLRDYPGPFWARASLVWRIYRSMDGRFHRHIEDCHKRYGE